MELKRLTTHFSYRIEPKPEGGFIARSADPTVPPLEAPTREELQQKIQAKLAAALGEAFPGPKLPLENKQRNFAVRVERKPGGGFTVHSDQPGTPMIEPASQEKIDHFAEELLGFVDKNFPHLSQTIAAQVGSRDLKIFATQKTAATLSASAQLGAAQGFPQAQPIQSSDVRFQEVQVEATTTQSPTINTAVIANTPITPESNSNWTIFRFLLGLLIIAALTYFFFHHH